MGLEEGVSVAPTGDASPDRPALVIALDTDQS